MQTNPILNKLGFADTDRVLITHADDVGMCQSTLPAFAELFAFGLVKSGAVMAPCAWFPAAAAQCRAHPEWDMGTHITLTSEWDTYRWRPLSTVDPASGLLDEEGFFYRSMPAAQEHADAAAAQAEMEAQVKKSLAAGIKVTHIDTHMGTVLHPKLIMGYAQTAFQFHVPLLAVRLDEEGWKAQGADAETAAAAVQFCQQLEASGMPLHEGLFWVPLEQEADRMGQYKHVLDTLPAGLSRLYLHPAVDTPELRAICPDWRSRVEDYRCFMSDELKAYIQKLGIHLIGYKEVMDAMQSA